MREWAHIEPLIPPGKPGGGRRVAIREVINGVMYILSTGCHGARCPGICRPEAACMITSACGTDGTLGQPSCALPQVPRESRARSQPHGLHHRQSECGKPLKKGGSHRQPRLRCRQADQGPKRHVLVDTQGLLGTASSPPPQAFRIATAVCVRAGDLVRSVSLSPARIVRRQRLSGPGLSPRPGRHPARSRRVEIVNCDPIG